MKPRAVLTGATGFLGLHLLPALLQAGFEVRILARREPDHPAWDGLVYETVRGSLEDGQALTALVQGADVVVHAAGLIKSVNLAGFMTVNSDGTARLAELTRRLAPAARFLLVSSLAAREPGLSNYAFSKHQAERAAKAAFADQPGQLAILRPPVIYGPWDRETLTIFQGTMRAFTFIPGNARTAVIHVSDAAGAIAALAQHWRAGCFALADIQPAGRTMRELIQAAAAATGGKARLVQAPDSVLLAAGYAVGFWSRLTGKPQVFGPGKAREMLHPDWTVSTAELLPPAIYTPALGHLQGFAETVSWYRQQGWL